MSSERLIIFETLIPAAGSNSFKVTTGPLLTFFILPFTPKSKRIFSRNSGLLFSFLSNFSLSLLDGTLSKLIDGTFPDYEKVIPVSNDKLLQVEAEPFFNAIDRVSTVNQDKTPTVKLQFENNSIKIMATSTDSNKGDEEVAANYAADGLEILFNSKYILDLQDVVEGDTLILELLNQSSPVIVKDPKDTTSLFILMPMRV